MMAGWWSLVRSQINKSPDTSFKEFVCLGECYMLIRREGKNIMYYKHKYVL